jgi:hypothetical protein
MSVPSLRALATLALVKAVESGLFRTAAGHLHLPLPEQPMRDCLSLLARRKKVSSSTLRPFLHAHMEVLELSAQCRSMDVARTVARTPRLTHLALRGCLGAGADDTAARVALLTGQLLMLDVSYNAALTDGGLALLLQANPSLVQLCCSWCDQLLVLPRPSLIQHLECAHCPRIRVSGGVYDTPWLQVLVLSHSTMTSLCLHCPLLRTLILDHCHSLTQLHTLVALNHCSHLALSACPLNVNIDMFPILHTLEAPLRQCPSLPLSLRVLVLDDAPSPISLTVLESLVHLQSLSVSSVRWEGSFPLLPQLHTLTAHRTSVPPMKQLPSLRVLDVCWGVNVDAHLLETLPVTLSVLRVYGCTAVTAHDINALKLRIPDLVIYHNTE